MRRVESGSPAWRSRDVLEEFVDVDRFAEEDPLLHRALAIHVRTLGIAGLREVVEVGEARGDRNLVQVPRTGLRRTRRHPASELVRPSVRLAVT